MNKLLTRKIAALGVLGAVVAAGAAWWFASRSPDPRGLGELVELPDDTVRVTYQSGALKPIEIEGDVVRAGLRSHDEADHRGGDRGGDLHGDDHDGHASPYRYAVFRWQPTGGSKELLANDCAVEAEASDVLVLCARDQDDPSQLRLWLRAPKEQRGPWRARVQIAADQGRWRSAAGAEGTLELHVPDDVPVGEELDVKFARAAAEAWRGPSHWNASPWWRQFSAFAAEHWDAVSRHQELPRQDRMAWFRDSQYRRPTWAKEVAQFTGLAGVFESLESVRTGTIDVEPLEARTIALKELPARMPAAGFAWPDADQLAPVDDVLAAAVPADALVIFATPAAALARTEGSMAQWAVELAQIGDDSPESGELLERYRTQLGWPKGDAAESWTGGDGRKAAVVLWDVELAHGAAVAVIVDGIGRDAARSAWSAGVDAARGPAPLRVDERPEADEARWKAATADERVRSVLVPLADGRWAVTNSDAAAEALQRVARSESPSMASELAFRVIRSRLPRGSGDADELFAVFTEAWIERMSSPARFFAASRREVTRLHLQAQNMSHVLRLWEGRPTAEPLAESGFLPLGHDLDSEGGAISFSADTGAHSAYWGYLGRMLPLLDAAARVDSVTAAEKQAWARFVDDRPKRERGATDPGGLRVLIPRDGGPLAMDAIVAPVLHADAYREWSDFAGTHTVAMTTSLPGYHQAFALDPDRIRETGGLTSMGSKFLGASWLDWLGEWVVFGALDRRVLWELALVEGGIPQRHDGGNDDYESMKQRRAEQEDLLAGAMSELPFYAAVAHSDKLGLAALLTTIRTKIDSTAPGAVLWEDAGSIEGYPAVRVRSAGGEKRKSLHQALQLYYVITDEALVLAAGQQTLEFVLREFERRGWPERRQGADGGAAAGQASAPGGWHVSAALQPRAGDASALRLLAAGTMEQTARASAQQALTIAQFFRRVAGDSESVDAIRRAALQWASVTPRLPHAMSFALGASGWLEAGAYGSRSAPVFPPLPIAGSPLSEKIASFRWARLGARFEAFEAGGLLRGQALVQFGED